MEIYWDLTAHEAKREGGQPAIGLNMERWVFLMHIEFPRSFTLEVDMELINPCIHDRRG